MSCNRPKRRRDRKANPARDQVERTISKRPWLRWKLCAIACSSWRKPNKAVGDHRESPTHCSAAAIRMATNKDKASRVSRVKASRVKASRAKVSPVRVSKVAASKAARIRAAALDNAMVSFRDVTPRDLLVG